MTEAIVQQGLAEICREAVKRHTSIEDAQREVSKRIERDPLLKASLVDLMMTRAILATIYSVRYELRDQARSQVGGRGAAVIASVGKVIGQSLLDGWSMPNGKMLGDCTGAELLPIAEAESMVAAGHARSAEFFSRLAASMPEDSTVRASIGERKARKMWDAIAGREDHRSTVTHTNGVARPRSRPVTVRRAATPRLRKPVKT